jgi:hypothetical protein
MCGSGVGCVSGRCVFVDVVHGPMSSMCCVCVWL